MTGVSESGTGICQTELDYFGPEEWTVLMLILQRFEQIASTRAACLREHMCRFRSPISWPMNTFWREDQPVGSRANCGPLFASMIFHKVDHVRALWQTVDSSPDAVGDLPPAPQAHRRGSF